MKFTKLFRIVQLKKAKMFKHFLLYRSNHTEQKYHLVYIDCMGVFHLEVCKKKHKIFQVTNFEALKKQFGNTSKILDFFVNSREELVVIRQDLCYIVFQLGEQAREGELLKVGKIASRNESGHKSCFLKTRNMFVFSELSRREDTMDFRFFDFSDARNPVKFYKRSMTIEGVSFYRVKDFDLKCYNLTTTSGEFGVFAFYYDHENTKKIQHFIFCEGDVFLSNQWTLGARWRKRSQFEIVDGNCFMFGVYNKFELIYLNSSFNILPRLAG